MSEILKLTDSGLYCEEGDFFIDPWRPVERALITHAHSDHARQGSASYLSTTDSEHLLRLRLGSDIKLECLDYGETKSINEVKVSFHPAGHVLGSAQIRVEYRGQMVVASGDYKLSPDPTCKRFEPVKCHTFITESTFGLPIYRWTDSRIVFEQINQWWQQNQKDGRPSILFAYSLGKAQRLLMGIDSTIGPIFTHGAVENLNQAYRKSGVILPDTTRVTESTREDWSRALIVAPPSAHGSSWMRKFSRASTAFASGWMRIRGARRRRSVDRGFVLSDHADWPELKEAICESGAEQVLVTHGYSPAMVRWLNQSGVEAATLETQYAGEVDDSADSSIEEDQER